MRQDGTTRAALVLGAAMLAAAGCGTNVHFGKDFDASFFDQDGGGPDAHADAGPMGSMPDGGGMGADEDGGVAPDASMDAGGAGDAGGPMAGAEAWPAQLAAATCDALMQCYGNAELLTDTLGGRDCVTLNENLLRNGELRYLPDSVKAGLVVYKPSELQGCLSDVRALGCDVRASRLPESCRRLLTGTKLTADECTIDLDCQSDAFCAKGMLATCPGVCAPLQSQDMPCDNNDDAQCQDGLICFRGTCAPLGNVGQTCDDTTPKCKPGLVCLDQGSGPQCATLDTLYSKQQDESCDPVSALCVPGLVCTSVDASNGTCQPPVGAGAGCKRGQPDPCPASQYCDATAPGADGVCSDRPGDGQACLSANRAPVCAPDSICISDTCRALQQVGGACGDSAECYSGSCGSDGTCAGPLMCAAP